MRVGWTPGGSGGDGRGSRGGGGCGGCCWDAAAAADDEDDDMARSSLLLVIVWLGWTRERWVSHARLCARFCSSATADLMLSGCEDNLKQMIQDEVDQRRGSSTIACLCDVAGRAACQSSLINPSQPSSASLGNGCCVRWLRHIVVIDDKELRVKSSHRNRLSH